MAAQPNQSQALLTPEVKLANILTQAVEAAESGLVRRVNLYIGQAREYAQQTDITLNEAQEDEIAETARLARVNAVGVNLAEAAESAKRGSVDAAYSLISKAREYAQQTGITLNEAQEDEIAETARLAKVNAVAVNLAEAAESSKRGLVDSADGCNVYISKARQYAKEVGIPLTEAQEAEIVATHRLARVNAIEVKLTMAAAWSLDADDGAAGIIQGYLRQVHRYTEEAGIQLTEEQIARIAALYSYSRLG